MYCVYDVCMYVKDADFSTLKIPKSNSPEAESSFDPKKYG